MRGRRLVLVLPLLLTTLAWLPREAAADEAPLPWYARLRSPAEALVALQAEVGSLSRNEQWNARPKLAAAYLDAFAATGDEVTNAEDRLALHRLNATARRFDEAVRVALPVLEDEQAQVGHRAQAAEGIAGYLTQEAVVEALGEDGLAELAASIEAFATSPVVKQGRIDASRLLFALAQYHGSRDAPEKEIALNMAAARASAGRAAQAGRSILKTLMAASTRLEEYDAIRAEAKASFDELRALAAGYQEAVTASGDEAAMASAASVVKLLEHGEAPLELLGAKAPAWTVEHAFGDVKELADLEGKVVFVDFWATWCGWCIRSFPAVRDLLRDYADEDLAIVGVTTSAPSVVEANYDLDDDMKHKLKQGATIRRIQLASDRTPADAAKHVYPADEYPEREREALTRFIANHEMTWPVVMIDREEPKAKYGLQGWPHAMLLDRQGRVRYFKVGALLRDREEQVKHFREILDSLLAESADDER